MYNQFFNTVLEVLKQDQRFFTDNGELLRNSVYEAAMQMDSKLIKLLLSNEETKKRFFADVEGVLVFDKVGFGWVINCLLYTSYTISLAIPSYCFCNFNFGRNNYVK